MSKLSLKELQITKSEEFASAFGLPNLPDVSVEAVLAKVTAVGEYSLYNYLDYIKTQLNPLTADEEFVLNWANAYGIERAQPTYAQGVATFIGEDDSKIPAGAVLVVADKKFQTLEDAVIKNEAVAVKIEALNPGTSSNKTAVKSRLLTPIVGVDSEATITTQNGLDLQSLDALKNKISKKLSSKYSFFEDDYWFKTLKAEHPQVSRVWLSDMELGVGSSVLRVICNDIPNRIASASLLEKIKITIDRYKIAGSRIEVINPKTTALRINIKLEPSQNSFKNLIIEKIADYIKSIDLQEAKVSIAKLAATINKITTDYELIHPVADITLELNYIAYLDEVIWS